MEDLVKNRILDSFKEKVLKLDKNDGEPNNNYTIYLLRYAIMLSMFMDIVLLVYDLFNGGVSTLYIVSTSLRLFFALVLFLITLYVDKQKTTQLLFTVAQTIYYVVIISTTTALQIEWNYTSYQASSTSQIYGVSIFQIHLFIMVFFQLEKLPNRIFIDFLTILSYFFPFFFVGRSAYPFVELFILRIFLFVVYFSFRSILNKLIMNNKKTKQLNEDLIKVSYMDALTNAMNKRALYKYIEYLSFNPEISTVGCCIFDIDDFKNYNDNYSHLKGDSALEKVSEKAINVLEKEQSYLFRYGGEEFVFFLINPSKEKLLETALKIKNEVYDAGIKREDTSYSRITITLGCSLEETVRRNDAEYVLIADKELYVGKNNGKNCVVLDGEIHR